MSDFPELDGFTNVPASTDPQADFLARERALLGDEFGGQPENYTPGTTTQHGDQQAEDQFGLGDFSAGHSHPPPVTVTGGAADELASFQDQYPDVSHDIPSTNTVSILSLTCLYPINPPIRSPCFGLSALALWP